MSYALKFGKRGPWKSGNNPPVVRDCEEDEVLFKFSTKEEADAFIGWFLDGGGDQEYYMSLEIHLPEALED